MIQCFILQRRVGQVKHISPGQPVDPSHPSSFHKLTRAVHAYYPFFISPSSFLRNSFLPPLPSLAISHVLTTEDDDGGSSIHFYLNRFFGKDHCHGAENGNAPIRRFVLRTDNLLSA